jgi:VWFA-related protein
MPTKVLWIKCLAVAALSVAGAGIFAQDAAQPASAPHEDVDSIELPVLVLDSDLQQMKPIDPARFQVSLDRGPVFAPKHVRQEGDDPIALAILLDMNSEADMMPDMSGAIAKLAPGALHAKDHVTLFALDCELTRTLNDVPADPAQLKAGVDQAVKAWNANRKAKKPCEKPVQLWDAMRHAVNELGQLPGRRVLIAVANGVDAGSEAKASDLIDLAQAQGVAIFGYSAPPASGGGGGGGGGGKRGGGGGGGGAPAGEPRAPRGEGFRSVCELSGGFAMRADPDYIGKQLARIVAMVRERYIVEFSRPRNNDPGTHRIEVTVANNNKLFIRTAGVSILAAEPALDKGKPN